MPRSRAARVPGSVAPAHQISLQAIKAMVPDQGEDADAKGTIEARTTSGGTRSERPKVISDLRNLSRRIRQIRFGAPPIMPDQHRERYVRRIEASCPNSCAQPPVPLR